MEEIDLLEQIKRRLEALQSRIESRVDPKLLAEVASAIQLADVHLPSAFMQTRRLLEIIVRDIYRRELPDAKVKPLVNMIEALYEQKRLIGQKIAADLHYIRANGNLIIHPQDEAVEIRPGDAEPVLFVFLGVVEWYLTVYLPERQDEAPDLLATQPQIIQAPVAHESPGESRAPAPARTRVFVSYSHRDRKLFEEIKTMLAPAEWAGLLDLWDDTRITPGANWRSEITAALAATKVALLLVSPSFLASRFIANHELPPLLAAAEAGGATVFWFHLSASLYKRTEIDNYQCAHDPAKPLDQLHRPKRQAAICASCTRLIELAQQR